jgi:hypothetical protein
MERKRPSNGLRNIVFAVGLLSSGLAFTVSTREPLAFFAGEDGLGFYAAFWILVAHFWITSSRLEKAVITAFFGVFGLAAFVSILFVGREDVSVVRAAGLLSLYGASLFVIVCDVLLAGGSHFLTARRGENWVKEIDYVYLSLGAVGVLGTLNKLDWLGQKSSVSDLLGPALLTTALVLRFVKTRAEVAGWNKPITSGP